MKVRMKFAKTGPLMYVGHLDLLRYFQKVFRRAGVDIAYSQGYSPHQILSFAAPLGIGVTSEGEYMDAEFHSTKSSEEMLVQINAACQTPFIKVTEFVELKEGAKKAMAAVAGADYRVTLESTEPSLMQCLTSVENFLQQPSIFVLKKTKKGETQWDIRPFIHDMRVDGQSITMRLTTGSVNNLKPELVMESLFAFCGLPYDNLSFRVHRLETLLWKEEEGCFAPLSADGHRIMQ